VDEGPSTKLVWLVAPAGVGLVKYLGTRTVVHKTIKPMQATITMIDFRSMN